MGTVDEADASPLAAAWRELHAVTTLTPDTLKLERQGKSFAYNPCIDREWTVYSFLFRLKTQKSAIQIAWEHDSWAWHNPCEILEDPSFSNIPLLTESLGRVWFEKDLGATIDSAGELLARGLRRLKNDHQSGARQLAGVALCVLRDVVRALGVEPGGEHVWWTHVRTAAWHIWKNGRESMGAAILCVLLDALGSIEGTLGTRSLDLIRDDAVIELDQRIARRADSPSIAPVSDALLEYLEKHFPKSEPTSVSSVDTPSQTTLSILTLSESSTIAHSLQQLLLRSHFTAIDLRILESRPLFEGVSLAASLVHYAQSQSKPVPYAAAAMSPQRPPTRININIFTDASAAMAAKGADVVLLGADRIASSGAVSNKTGSLPAALGAKQSTFLSHGADHSSSSALGSRAAQVIVLGETEKIATPGDPHAHIVEDMDPTQLSRDWHSSFNSRRIRDAAACLDGVTAAASGQMNTNTQVQVHNVFFEWVPPELVDAYITEKGVWTLQDIGMHSTALGREEERMFGGI